MALPNYEKNLQDNITITSDYQIDDNSCFKSQNFVHIGLNIYNSSGTFSKGTWVTIAQLPEGYRPTGWKYLSGFGCSSAWSSATAVPIMVEPNGAIEIYVYADLKRIILNGIITL